jgi:preprotein translocase subunit SecE
MEKIRAQFNAYTEELLYKVQWPSLEDLQSSTVTVLIASVLIALAIGLMDIVFKTSMDGLYSLFN